MSEQTKRSRLCKRVYSLESLTSAWDHVYSSARKPSVSKDTRAEAERLKDNEFKNLKKNIIALLRAEIK